MLIKREANTTLPEIKMAQHPHSSVTSEFYIVGIGASAGGLEALEQFFGNMPEDTGMAFVVIQHLDPDRPTILPELLQRVTRMKVSIASEGLLVQPNIVYVIPPNKSLTLNDTTFQLHDITETRGLRLPVDIFFRSLAENMKNKSVGIILSGMGSDGSHGIIAIKENNGVTMVQEPASAKYNGMPNSANATEIIDILAPASELPNKLIAHLKLSIPKKAYEETENKNEVLPEPEQGSETIGKNNIDKIIHLLLEQTGHDFSFYKKNTIFRRIERRKNIHQIDKIQVYVQYLKENSQEREILFKELLIGVTNFFRDQALWNKLRDVIIPELIGNLPEGYLIRAWIPACSTGEEAYSLAIVFKEAIEKLDKKVFLQIFATDLDIDAIEKARKGSYKKIQDYVSKERIDRFFTVEGDNYQINNSIREMIVFAPQNLIKDPPFTKLEILSCRNVLIYIEPEFQKKLISLFTYSLNPGGIMILGTAETIGSQQKSLEELDSKMKIYRRSANSLSHDTIDFPSLFFHKKTIISKETNLSKKVDNIQNLTDQILLQRFSPSSVLVNNNGDIVYITGKTGKYLEPVAGKANWNIYAMAREGIRQELPAAFRRAMLNFEPVVLRNVKIYSLDAEYFVDITIQQIEEPESIKGFIIVIFSDVTAPKTEQFVSGIKSGSSRQRKVLEFELKRSQEELKVTREEMQTSQEELKSINEELQSMNEELQSANEELTTSKEEMQSLNEELQTVNIELHSKVNDLLRMNDDMKNFLNSTEIATLFLDKDLNIRRFTDLVTNIFKLRNTDIGRPFTDLVSQLQYPEMDVHAKQVLKNLSPMEKSITTHDGLWFNVRIMPYRTLDDRIDGLVITFTDITIAKKLELALKIANEELTRAKERN